MKIGAPGWRDEDIGIAPDIETASADYARRFSGPAGQHMLAVQANLVSKALSPYSGGTLLELGGGHGQLLSTYQALSIAATLHGSAPSCFTRLRDDGFERPIVVSPLDKLPFADRSFDVVVAIRLVSHLVQWQTVVTEMCRVAREAVLIDYPSRYSLNAIAPMMFSLKKKFEGNTRVFALFNKHQITQPFMSSGFGRIIESKQFFLPMALHRMLGSSPVAARLEDFSRRIGLTSRFGSPVILLANRPDAGRYRNSICSTGDTP